MSEVITVSGIIVFNNTASAINHLVNIGILVKTNNNSIEKKLMKMLDYWCI